MAQLSTKVKAYVEAAGKTVDFSKDVLLQDDSQGAGPYIKEWNIAGLAQPSDADLAAQAKTHHSSLGGKYKGSPSGWVDTPTDLRDLGKDERNAGNN